MSYNEKHWSNEAETLAVLNQIINLFITKIKKELGLPKTQKALLVWDAFTPQSTDKVMRELVKQIANFDRIDGQKTINYNLYNTPRIISGLSLR